MHVQKGFRPWTLQRLKPAVVPRALLFVFHSVSPPKFVGSDPPSRTEGRATDVTDINLLDETEGAKTHTANRVTAALNSACSSSGRNGLLPLRGGVRRKLLPPLWRARGSVAGLVRCSTRCRRLAMPSVRHVVQRELLPAMRSSDGSLGGPAAASLQHGARPVR